MNLLWKKLIDSRQKSIGKQSLEGRIALLWLFSSPSFSASLPCRRTGLSVSFFSLLHSVHILSKLTWKGKGFKCTGEGELPECSRMLCSSVGGRWCPEQVGKHLSKGLLLIKGREHVISLALVVFHYASASLQFPWQELLYCWRWKLYFSVEIPYWHNYIYRGNKHWCSQCNENSFDA